MNVRLNTATDLRQLQTDAVQAQRAVLDLVDREKDLLKEVEGLGQIADRVQRLDAAASIIVEADGLAEIHKTLSDQIDRVRKRVAAISDKLRAASLDDLNEMNETKLDTGTFELLAKNNPPSVFVDDEEKVPKAWRREPPPIPPWKEWPLDKNSIKAALSNGTKKSIPGVHLESSKRLEINRK